MVLVSAPLVGILADRVGVRVVALTSLVLFGLSYMSFALSTGVADPVLRHLVPNGLRWAPAPCRSPGPAPSTRGSTSRTKGLALGLCLVGTGVFGILCKPLVSYWIATLGWRGAYVATGLLPILIASCRSPLAVLPQKAPRARSSRATMRASKAAKALREADATGTPDLAQALRDWRFRLLTGTAVTATQFALGGPTPNMENILWASNGFSIAPAGHQPDAAHRRPR